jgi:hypothetical protein
VIRVTLPTAHAVDRADSGMGIAARLGIALVIVTLVAIGGLAATARAGERCRLPEDSNVVHRSATAIVYRRQRTATSASYEACLRSSGRRTDLPDAGTSRALSSFRSAGRYMAFIVDEAVPHDMTASVAIRVVDLRAGAPRRGIVLATAAGQPDALRFRSLILTSTGAAAWRETGRSQQASRPVDRIAARDVTGERRILHTAPYKTISSLKLLRGKIAEWSAGKRTYRRRIDTLGR